MKSANKKMSNILFTQAIPILQPKNGSAHASFLERTVEKGTATFPRRTSADCLTSETALLDLDYQYDLILYRNNCLNEFLKFLLPKEGDKPTFLQKLKTIYSIQISFTLDEDAKVILRKILEELIHCKDALINLRYLEILGFYDSSNFPIPDFIPFRINNWDHDGDKYDLRPFKSIIIGLLPDVQTPMQHRPFKLENLPNLESLTIENLRRKITIKLKEVPKLTSININKEPVHFERSIKTITIDESSPHPHCDSMLYL